MIKVKESRNKTGVSVVKTLAEIKDFVRYHCKDIELVGFNVLVGKRKGVSYVLAKTKSPFPKDVLVIDMDYYNPIERPLIANAIHEGIHQKSMTAQAMEDEMICKTTDYEAKHEN